MMSFLILTPQKRVMLTIPPNLSVPFHQESSLMAFSVIDKGRDTPV